MGSAAVFEIEGQNEPIIVMTQPTKNNPSANKAELTAIYMALLISHPHNRITLNYDCENAVNDIKSFQKYSLTQRLKLKTKDYPLVQAIVILLEKFDHPVTFNKIPRALNSADGPSKIAREETLPTLQISEAHKSPHQYQMTVNNRPDTTYPRRYINDNHQLYIQETNNSTLRRLWNNKLDSEIDCDRTLQVATTGLDRKNHLDANLYQVQTHIANTCLRNLQSMDIRFNFKDNLFADNYCHMCDGAFIEDQDHAWECEFAKSQRHEILGRAKELALNDLKRPDKITSLSTISRAFSMLNLTPDNILANPLTKRIVTKRNMRRSNALAKIIPGYSRTWIVNISAALARSFWELVWSPRTAKVEGIRKELEASKRETERFMALGVKRRLKQRRKEEKIAKAAAKALANAELKAAKKADKILKDQEKKRLDKEKKKSRKRKRVAESESDEDEIPIYTSQQLRAKRASQRAKLDDTSTKRKRDPSIIDTTNAKRSKPNVYELRPRRIQQSTDPPGRSTAPD